MNDNVCLLAKKMWTFKLNTLNMWLLDLVVKIKHIKQRIGVNASFLRTIANTIVAENIQVQAEKLLYNTTDIKKNELDFMCHISKGMIVMNFQLKIKRAIELALA